MNRFVVAIVFLLSLSAKAQNTIRWNESYQLQFLDFQSPSTRIGKVEFYTLHATCGFGFAFSMNNFEFMTARNFNSFVENTFTKDASSIIAPDSETAERLLSFARFQFDLSELYARKLRKGLYEEKTTFSKSDFYRPVFDSLNREYQREYDVAGNETELGGKRERLAMMHAQVLLDIRNLADFCKECTPPKKKKR